MFTCDTCGKVGNHDDGIADDGDSCPDEDCPGTCRLSNSFGVTMTCEYDGEGLDDDGRQWPQWPHHRWSCLLTSEGGGGRMLVKRGVGLTGEPTLAEALDCLQTDARILEFDEFDDVFDGLPYSKARKMADAIKAQVVLARRLFGEHYDAFLKEEYEV